MYYGDMQNYTQNNLDNLSVCLGPRLVRITHLFEADYCDNYELLVLVYDLCRYM